MRVLLLRHGETVGNAERQYIGRTDEPLSAHGIAQAKSVTAPKADIIYTSPCLRCTQTADLIFPSQPHTICSDLRECDFGVFEGRTAAEMVSDPDYLAWVQSGCTAPIPQGERIGAFKQRCCDAFEWIIRSTDRDATLAFVIHGGCIMAILERFDVCARGFYHYHIGNCRYLLCSCTPGSEISLTIEGGALC